MHDCLIRLDGKNIVTQFQFFYLSASGVFDINYHRLFLSLSLTLHCLADNHQPIFTAGDSTTHRNQVSFGINQGNLEVLYRNLVIAHPSGHTSTSKHSAWRSAGPNRARRPPTIRLTVCFRAAAKMMPLYHPGIPLTLAGTNYINCITNRKDRGINFLAFLITFRITHTKFVQMFYRRRPRFFQMTSLGFLKTL